MVSIFLFTWFLPEDAWLGFVSYLENKHNVVALFFNQVGEFTYDMIT